MTRAPLYYWFENSNKQALGCSPHMGSFVPRGKKVSCGYDPACTRGHQVTGAWAKWMRVLISVPGRGGTQPALLQSNFANHILWLKSGSEFPGLWWCLC